MKKVQNILGFIGVILVLVLGKTLLKTDMLFFRLLIGAGLGYALTRAYTGFAGTVNRAYRSGSSKLMRTLMYMFFISSVLTSAFLFKADLSVYSLWINPINLGLLLGGLLFGFGMTFSACCATGVLTDLTSGFPRAAITLFFFSVGVFIGFPIQKTASWVRQSWFTSPVGEQYSQGVYFPDLFKWDGLDGYLGAILLTAILCGLVVFLSYRYEKLRKGNNTYTDITAETTQDQLEDFDIKNFKLLSSATFNRVFVRPWTLKQGAVVISILFTLLMGITKSGWGASTPYGLWFGKLLMIFGVSADSLSSFSHMPADAFNLPLFEHAVSVQNIGIIIGAMLYLLMAGIFDKTFMSEMHITRKEVMLFTLGGLTMGFGTRLANGCNVGALYTPIANFSLSGWIFFLFLVFGGIIGNMVSKRITKI